MTRSELRCVLIASLLVILFASLSNLLLAAGNPGPIRQRTTPIYRPDAEAAALRRFFQPDTDDMRRPSLLVEFGLVYLFYGPYERALGT